MLTLLAVAALVAGVTGAWSPCGFSMVETLAPHGYASRRSVTLAACATFAAGALAGGVATFGGLALLGAALGAGRPGTVAAAAGLALAAALAEARGTRIVPQVRRQVPEPWRRTLPVPLAAGLYGVLLGLGFTTFILTFAVWALAGLSVALGDPAAGLAIGLGFGVGRALPVVALAPLAGGERGSRVHAAMAERPTLLRVLRALDAAALLACAVALAAGPASAASPRLIARGATDPSTTGRTLVFGQPGGAGRLLRNGIAETLPGRFPAAGYGLLAWTDGATITVAKASTREVVAQAPAPGADAIAVSLGYLAWRAGDAIFARPLLFERPTQRVAAGAGLGRPAFIGDELLYHQATATRSRIIVRDLADGLQKTLVSARGALLLNPSGYSGELLYVRSTRTRQQLRLRARSGRERVLYATTPTARRDDAREPGNGRHHHRGRIPHLAPRPHPGETITLWTTALTARDAYVTRLRATKDGGSAATLLRIPR